MRSSIVRADGVLGLKRAAGDGDSAEPFRLDPEPAPRLSIEQAIEWLNTAHETFLFFLEGGIGGAWFSTAVTTATTDC